MRPGFLFGVRAPARRFSPHPCNQSSVSDGHLPGAIPEGRRAPATVEKEQNYANRTAQIPPETLAGNSR